MPRRQSLAVRRKWLSRNSGIGRAVDSSVSGSIHPARRMPSTQEGNTESQTRHTRGLQENKQHNVQSDAPGVPKENSQPHRGGKHPGQLNRHSKLPARRESNRKRSRRNMCQLAKETSDGEIYSLIGNSVPGGGVYLLQEVREYSLKQLTQPDRKLLPPPRDVEEPQAIGRTAFAALKRVCSVPLASRAVFQVDQAASADQVVLWDLGERRQEPNLDWVRLFFVEKFSPYSWAFLPADASLQCSVRGDSNQASTYPRLSGGQPSLETVPNTVGLSPSGALPSGHSRGVLVRFHGQGDRPVMAVTTGFQGRRFDVPEARTGVPCIDLPSPAPCVAADAVFADAKAFLSSNEARQMSESELERELHRRGQKLVRKLLQGHHDQRSPGQAAGPAEDASGVECSARREHDSHAETTSGTMQVVGLGCARRGHDGLHPLDAALNLLPERSLVDMRRRVTIATASRAPPRTPWKPQWYSTLSTWQRRCGVRCSSPAP